MGRLCWTLPTSFWPTSATSSAFGRCFDERAPDVVFHAAALKHLPMLEQYPEEAWKTNVLGTLHVLDAARESGVGVFVNISTDKAADPTSVLGYSKRIVERLTSAVAQPGARSLRLGAVRERPGQQGVGADAFADQIDNGGPVTVTHPQVTRYFMTIPEAVQLVIQAAAIGTGRRGPGARHGRSPFASRMSLSSSSALSGRDIDIVFTGLRPGEKMHEDLLGTGEHAGLPRAPACAARRHRAAHGSGRRAAAQSR